MNLYLQNLDHKKGYKNHSKQHTMQGTKGSFGGIEGNTLLKFSRSNSRKMKTTGQKKSGGMASGNDYSLGELFTRKSSLNCFKRMLKVKPLESPLTSLRQSKQ